MNKVILKRNKQGRTHILDLGAFFTGNANDYHFKNRTAHSGFVQSIIKTHCKENNIDWHETDIQLALQVGCQILMELEKSQLIKPTQRELIYTLKNKKVGGIL